MITEFDMSKQSYGRMVSTIAKHLIDQYKILEINGIKKIEKIIIKNIKEIVLTGRKKNNKIIYKHTGYPGRLKYKKMFKELEKGKIEILIRSIRLMLPKNKISKYLLKRIIIEKK